MSAMNINNQISTDNSICLSVIVPIYGVEEYLEECIESIINQTYKNIEIILVDDGAKGREPQICDHYSELDSRIKVIHKQNAGLVAARKSGLELASSPYVTFVDGDDYIEPDLYQKIMKWIMSENPDAVLYNFTSVNDGVRTTSSQFLESGIYENERLAYFFQNMNCKDSEYYNYGVFPSVWSKIFKTELLRETSRDIPEKIRMGEDAAFTFPYLLKCRKIVVDNSITDYCYRIVPNSMSRTKDVGLFTGSAALYQYLKPIYASTDDKKIKNQLEAYHILLAEIALTHWRPTKLIDIPATCIKMKKYEKQSRLFDNLDLKSFPTVRRHIQRELNLISKSLWIPLVLIWCKRFIIRTL